MISYKNLDKLFFPKNDILKKDIINYYKTHSTRIMKHWKDRALTLHRFPNGIEEKGFFQKNASDFFPKWIETKTIKTKNKKSVSLIICNKKATIYYLADMGVISFHLWLSKKKDLHLPDRLIFDLDPYKSFKDVIKAAKILRKILEDLKLNCFVMTTGSKGLHIVVPILMEKDFSFTHEISKKIAQIAISKNPDFLTLEMSKQKRKNKVFIDYIRNSYGQTTIAPYSIRAIKNAPVAAPIEWKELDEKNFNPQKYTIKNIKKTDPWKDINKKAKSLVKACKKLC